MNRGLALFILLLLLILGGTILLGTQTPPDTQQSINTADPAYSLVTVELNATSTGQISLYGDQNVTIPLTPINWGTLSPGETRNRTIYVTNANNRSWTLTVRTANWTPAEAEQHINFTMANTTLKPLSTTPVTFTLTVAENVPSNLKFSFNIFLRVN